MSSPRQGRRTPVALAVIAAVSITACSEDRLPTSPAGLPRLTTQLAVAAVDSQARTGRDPEAVPTRIALAVPGFGGFAYDTADGELIIWMKDRRQESTARVLVAQYLATQKGGGGKAGRNPPTRIQIADFDFLELGAIRDRVNAALETEPGVRQVGISMFTNRVEVRVEQNAADRIAGTLARAGIPEGARRIVTFQPLFGSPDPTTLPPVVDSMSIPSGSAAPPTLGSKLFQIGGGLMMVYLSPSGQQPVNYLIQRSCTVGAIVKNESGAIRMLTASHCSNTMGQVDGRSYWQPMINNYDKTKLVPDTSFAFETTDAGWKSALPSWIAYKWADALLATWTPITLQNPDFGHIYRPATYRGSADWSQPSIVPNWPINTTYPKFTIVGPGTLGSTGEILHKVGYRTGWTSGPTLNNCEDITYGVNNPKPTVRCQLVAAIPSHIGDSGGPIFRIINSDSTNVEFIGITGAGDVANHQTSFSPWSKILQELGTLTVAP